MTELLSTVASSVPSNMDMLNSFSSMATNLMNQRWSEKMYERSRNDALSFWSLQNEYNSPSAQMARLTAAGLSPHLVYGQGAGGGNAGPIQTPDTQPVNFREPRFQGNSSSAIAQSMLLQADLEIKAAQADNLRAQNEEIRQSGLLRALQAERAGFDLNFERSLADVSADYRRENLRKLKIETQISLNRDIREAAQNSSNLTEAFERVLSMRESRKNTILDRDRTYSEIKRTNAETARLRQTYELLKQDGTLKEIEIELRKSGINPNDPMWQRYLGLIIQGFADEGKDFMNSLPKSSNSSSGGVNYRPDFGPK